MRRVASIGALVAMAGVAGCGSGVTRADLDGRQYMATAVSDPAAVPKLRQLTLDFAVGRLAASGGCNGPAGPYVLQGDQLSFGDEALVSLVGCGDPYPRQDDWIERLLTPAATVSLRDGGRVLELRRGGQHATFGLEGPKDGPNPIEGQGWRAVGVEGNGVGIGIEGPMVRPALRIQDGTATIFAGCNSGTAPVDVGDRDVTFGRFKPTTHRPCGRYVSRIDRIVRQILDGRTSVRFEGSYGMVIEHAGQTGLRFTSATRQRR